MLIRLRTNLGIKRLKLPSRVDGQLSLRELKLFIRDTLHIETRAGAMDAEDNQIVLSRDGTKITVFTKKSDDDRLSDLNIVHGSEIYLMGQYVMKERTKVTVNEDGDILPVGSFYVRIDNNDYSSDILANANNVEIAVNDDASAQLFTNSSGVGQGAACGNSTSSSDHGNSNAEYSMHMNDDSLAGKQISDDMINNNYDDNSKDELITHKPRDNSSIESACIHEHDDWQLRSSLSHLPGAAAFIYDNNNFYSGHRHKDLQLPHTLGHNGHHNDEWMADADYSYEDNVRPADEVQRRTLLDGFSSYDDNFNGHYVDTSTTTTPRLSQSDQDKVTQYENELRLAGLNEQGIMQESQRLRDELIAQCMQIRWDEESTSRVMKAATTTTDDDDNPYHLGDMVSELENLRGSIISKAKRPTFRSYVASVKTTPAVTTNLISKKNTNAKSTKDDSISSSDRNAVRRPTPPQVGNNKDQRHVEYAVACIDRKVPLRRGSKLGVIAQRSLVANSSSIVEIDSVITSNRLVSSLQRSAPSQPDKSTAQTAKFGRSNSPRPGPSKHDVGLSLSQAKLSPRLRVVQQSLTSSTEVGIQRQLSPRIAATNDASSLSLVGTESTSSRRHGSHSTLALDEFDALLDQSLLDLGIAYSQLH